MEGAVVRKEILQEGAQPSCPKCYEVARSKRQFDAILKERVDRRSYGGGASHKRGEPK